MAVPEDQFWMFPVDCVVMQQICLEFEETYPGQKYELTFERSQI